MAEYHAVKVLVNGSVICLSVRPPCRVEARRGDGAASARHHPTQALSRQPYRCVVQRHSALPVAVEEVKGERVCGGGGGSARAAVRQQSV